MKRICIIALLIILFIPNCGGNDETELRIDIAEHPESGVYVTELPCIIVGCLYDEDDVTEIAADFQWMWSETSTGPDTTVIFDHYTFTETSMQEVNLSLFAPEGYYFVGFWWMEIYWTDEDGTAHYLESNKAHCTGTLVLNELKSKPFTLQLTSR